MRPNCIQRMQALTQLNYEAWLNFVTMMRERHQGDDQWLKRWMFTDEVIFHVSGRVNTHNCLIWGTENSHVSYELERAPALNRMCGAEWPLRKSTDHSFLRRRLFVLSVILTWSSSMWSLNYSKMGYWTPLSSNRMALRRIGLS